MAGDFFTINFLKNNGGRYFDRFVNWALSVGRVVVILNEAIALGAFLYRFSLDRQLIDIHAKIKQEQAVVSYLKTNEETYKNLQNRLALSSTFSKKGKEKVTILKDVLAFTPSGVNFNNVTIQEDRIRIDANTASVSPLSDLVNSLKNYPRIANVIVDKIETRPSSALINVSITALLKQQP